LKKLSKILIIICLIVFNLEIEHPAGILKIKSAKTILGGDKNRNLLLDYFV